MNKHIRTVGVLMLALALAAAMTFSGGASAAGPGDDEQGAGSTGPVGNVEQDVPITTDALGTDAEMYASEWGISLAEAKRRLRLQESAGELGANLETNEPGTFAGLWIQHGSEFRIVTQFTRDGDNTVQRYDTWEAVRSLTSWTYEPQARRCET